jgi:hypothetical protein
VGWRRERGTRAAAMIRISAATRSDQIAKYASRDQAGDFPRICSDEGVEFQYAQCEWRWGQVNKRT